MTDDRVSLFFMDYPNKTRLKLFGRAKIIGLDDEATLSRLETPDYSARVERGFLIVEGFDWNFPQRIAELEAELARLRTAASVAGASDHASA